MKTTRWFIEYWNEQHCRWFDSSVHNPPKGWESKEAAENWVTTILLKGGNYRVNSREVEVGAKDVLKVKSTIVELELANAWYRRKEEGESIEWSQYSIEARWSDDRGWVQTYSTHNGKVWREQDEDCYIRDCEEPEIE